MPEQFLHGVEVLDLDSGLRAIRTVKSAVIGLVGTAPKGPINKPVLIRGSRTEAVREFGESGGTIPGALAAIFDQVAAAVVVVNVFDPETHLRTVAAKDYALDGDTATLDHTGATSVVVKGTGANSSTTYTEDTDYTFVAATGVLTRMSSGAIASGATLSVSYQVPDPAATPATAVVGGTDGETGAYKGAQALIGAEAVTGAKPQVLIAPGFTGKTTGSGQTLASAVGAALVRVAERLRATAVLDGPNTTDSAAIAFRKLFSSRRAFVVDPWVETPNGGGPPISEPPSSRVAGVIARNDVERGFWHSPSNRAIEGITGMARPTDFVLGDPTARANVLNADEVATVIRTPGGFRLWGNRTCATDSRWAFLSVARTADLLNESLLRAHLWAVDRNITRTYLEEVSEGVNAYIRDLVGRGALLGGRCVPSEQNTPQNIQAGKVYFDFEYTAPYPAERIVFRSLLTDNHITEVIQ